MQVEGSFGGHKKKGDTGALQRHRRHPASLLRCALNLTVRVLRRNRLSALATIILYEKTTRKSSKFLADINLSRVNLWQAAGNLIYIPIISANSLDQKGQKDYQLR